MKLLELQRWMASTVMSPLTPENRLDRERAMVDSTVVAAEKLISPSTKLTAVERLEIYNRQFWFRVLDSMRDDFPAVRAFTGDDEFKSLVVRYLRSNPSTYWTLRNMGMKFEPWLRGSAGPQESLLVAADIARIEWAYIEAYDTPEYPGLDPVQLQRAGNALELRLQPHVRLVRVDHAVHEFVEAVHNGKDEPESSFQKKTEFLAVFRQNFIVKQTGLTPLGSLVLHGLRHRRTLEDVFNVELAHQTISSDDIQEIGKHFQEWSRLGFFTCLPHEGSNEDLNV